MKQNTDIPHSSTKSTDHVSGEFDNPQYLIISTMAPGCSAETRLRSERTQWEANHGIPMKMTTKAKAKTAAGIAKFWSGLGKKACSANGIATAPKSMNMMRKPTILFVCPVSLIVIHSLSRGPSASLLTREAKYFLLLMFGCHTFVSCHANITRRPRETERRQDYRNQNCAECRH